MRITVIGTGHVGLVAGAGLADFGHCVTCVDKDLSKVDMLRRGEMPIFEPGLPELVQHNVAVGRLAFSTDIEATLRRSTVVFIAVGTEGLPNGAVDLQAVNEVAGQLAATMELHTIIVVKSTVPVGTAASITRLIRASSKRRIPFDVVSNPEFQREGSAVQDFMRPDRIVIGATSPKAVGIIREIYAPLLSAGRPLVVTSNETAEMIKYAANAFLASKISFINEIANLCDHLNCDVQAVAEALGLDPRIGPKFLQPGPGFGGSCFPKDSRALLRLANECGVEMYLVEAAVRVNEAQPRKVVEKVLRQLGSMAGRKIAVLGLAYKPNTDDVRGSPAIDICQLLLKEGARLRVYDPEAISNSRQVLGNSEVEFCSNPYEAAQQADCLLVLTEWDEFRNLNLKGLRSCLRGRSMIDARNVIDPQAAANAGFLYEGMGRAAFSHPKPPRGISDTLVPPFEEAETL